MADKMTEVHRAGDTVALMVMIKKGELQEIFVDYLLVTTHTREALMTQFYDDTLIQKLRLSPEEIRQQCTGATFDGQYFSLNCSKHLARRMVKQEKGGRATKQEIQDSAEWMLCIWYPAHKLELVVNDIRVDKLDLDMELMLVPWYAQTQRTQLPCMRVTVTASNTRSFLRQRSSMGRSGIQW